MIAGIVGLITGLSVSFYDNEVSTNRFFLEKQVQSADQVAIQFSRYVENWRRVVELNKYLSTKKSPISVDEKKQYKSIVFARNDARDKLFSGFDSLNLYYTDFVTSKVNEFKDWDEKQAIKTMKNLPSIIEWKKRKKQILIALRKELVK